MSENRQAKGQATEKLAEVITSAYFTTLPSNSLLVTQVMHLLNLSLILIKT